MKVNHICFPIAREGLHRQPNPTGAEGAAAIEAIGTERQAIELLQQGEPPLAVGAWQDGIHSRAPWRRIGGEELAVHTLGQQALMEPQGAAGGTTAEGAGRHMQHPHGASTR